MTARFFVDTNILVYSYDTAQGAKQAIATHWLERLWREQSGRTGVQVLNELYVTLTRKLSRRIPANEAWEIVQGLLAWAPQPVDGEVLQRAREIEHRSRIGWWDSLIVAAAQLQDCEVLLSEDLQHGMVFGPVSVQNPFASTVQEPRVEYRVDALAARHRPRGRPRKQAASRQLPE